MRTLVTQLCFWLPLAGAVAAHPDTSLSVLQLLPPAQVCSMGQEQLEEFEYLAAIDGCETHCDQGQSDPAWEACVSQCVYNSGY